MVTILQTSDNPSDIDFSVGCIVRAKNLCQLSFRMRSSLWRNRWRCSFPAWRLSHFLTLHPQRRKRCLKMTFSRQSIPSMLSHFSTAHWTIKFLKIKLCRFQLKLFSRLCTETHIWPLKFPTKFGSWYWKSFYSILNYIII